MQGELHPDLAAKFTFKVADATDLPFEDGTFDVSVSLVSSIAPLDSVWLPGYPAPIRCGAKLEFKVHRMFGYLGHRVGYAFQKPAP